MKSARNRWWAPIVLVGLVTACGGGEQGADAAATTAAPESRATTPTAGESNGGSQGQVAPPSGGGGSITVDGVSYDAQQVFSCEPDDAGEGALEVVVFAEDGRGLSIDVYSSERMDMATGETSVEFGFTLRLNVASAEVGQLEYETSAREAESGWTAGDDGVPLAAPPYEVTGDNFRGGLTLRQQYPEDTDATVDVAFDVELPEPMECP